MTLFCIDSKNRSSGGNRDLLELINFFALEGPGVESPAAPKLLPTPTPPPPPKKKKWKNRKRQTNFFVFDFLNFKLVSIDLESNSALGNHTLFYPKCGSGTQKSNETRNLKNRVKIEKKNICNQKALDGGSGRTKIFAHSRSSIFMILHIHDSSVGQIRFSFWSFNFWPRSNFHQNTLKRCKK